MPTQIRDYCGEHTVALLLKALCEQVPEAIPNYRTWNCPDPLPGIVKRIREPGYVEDCLPAVLIMMGSNAANVQWTARVIAAMAIFDTAKHLGRKWNIS